MSTADARKEHNCRKHTQPVPLLRVKLQGLPINVGWFCIFCNNFIPDIDDASLISLQKLLKEKMFQ